ncbi:MFS transporter [Lacisediminimonas profundi]|uniref:MFS transporter n=1 Tax=Lacisediminimonas profundi TaxID=2603856 RepID=UPI00124BA98A|nr:MFS transporter [Lacisediminimonas profundi]
MTLGAGGMYVVPVVLPAVQADFGITRADASLPYTLLMVGFGAGCIVLGKMADRFGVMVPLLIGGVALAAGYALASVSSNILLFALAHGLLIGFLGCASTFVPLIADTSLWFLKRRGIAVAVASSGNYLGGVIWPPILQYYIETIGWRQSYLLLGLFSGLVMVLLALLMKRRPPLPAPAPVVKGDVVAAALPFGMSPNRATAMLCIAGVGCCVAMAMPQVHIVAYCGDLGYGAARGAEMLSLMLAFGIASRLICGAISDRIGGLRTILMTSALQALALLLFLPFDGLASLYVISALFGMFQGGLVPAYAIIVREYFPPSEAGARVGMVMTFTMVGMALGGWMSGKIFDLTGSYQAAFLNGFAFNLVNFVILLILLMRVRRRGDPLRGIATA